MDNPSSPPWELFKAQWISEVPSNPTRHPILAHTSYNRATLSMPNILHTRIRTKMLLRKCVSYQHGLGIYLLIIWLRCGEVGDTREKKWSNPSLQLSYRFTLRLALNFGFHWQSLFADHDRIPLSPPAEVSSMILYFKVYCHFMFPWRIKIFHYGNHQVIKHSRSLQSKSNQIYLSPDFF